MSGKGAYLRFFMLENHRHHGILLYEWLLEQAKAMGIRGGSAFRAIAGFGRHGVIHEQHFFELAGDLAVRVDFVVSDADADRLLELVDNENLSILYARLAAEFGMTGEK
ncbi:MAG TPA: DUF190 domain-containing protein [Rudaea sp.]|nr:DUF190 domain-containing protein [Rudaea sp.]